MLLNIIPYKTGVALIESQSDKS